VPATKNIVIPMWT